MQQIAEWLAKIGLERYAAAFVDNDIDMSVLRYLTDADLEKIGVSLGHRRKLLAAIAEIAGGKATAAQPPTETHEQEAAERRESAATMAADPASLRSALVEAAGERRYLTVMFCDLVARLPFRLSPHDPHSLGSWAFCPHTRCSGIDPIKSRLPISTPQCRKMA